MSWNVFIVNVVYDDNSPVENAKVVYNFDGQNQYYTGYTGGDGLLKIVAEGAQTNYTNSKLNIFDEELYLESRDNNITIREGNTYTFVLDCSDIGLTYKASICLIDYLYYSISISDYPIVYQYKLYYKNDQNDYVYQTGGTLNHEWLNFNNYRMPTNSIKIELINDEYVSSPFERYFDYSDNGGSAIVFLRVLKSSYVLNLIDINDTIDWHERGKNLLECDVTFFGYDEHYSLIVSSTTISANPTRINVDVNSLYSVSPTAPNTIYNLKNPQKNSFKVTKNHYNDYQANCFISANTDIEFFIIESGKTINDPAIIEREPNVCMTNKDLYDYLISLTGLRPDLPEGYEPNRVGISTRWFTYLWTDSIRRYLDPEYQTIYPDTVENFKTLFVNQLNTPRVSTVYTNPSSIENSYTLDKLHGYVWDRCFIPISSDTIDNCLTFVPIHEKNENIIPTVSLNKIGNPNDVQIEYRIGENGSWNSYVFDTEISFNDRISFRRALSNTGITFSSVNGYYNFQTENNGLQIVLSGSVTSLLDGKGKNDTELSNSCFIHLFDGCNISQARYLELPTNNLTSRCYESMFFNCDLLTVGPDLPAMALANSCYQSMFENCISLMTAPELPVTDLTNYSSCYLQMFAGCTSLTAAPNLPATALSQDCYCSMFMGCTSLTEIPQVLPSLTLSPRCYLQMFEHCSSLTTTPSLPSTNLEGADSCYFSMFLGCNSLTAAPNLPATTLSPYCYGQMFSSCINITAMPSLLADSLTEGCYQRMFQGCTSLTGVTNLSARLLAVKCYESMFENCSSLQTPPQLNSASGLMDECCKKMFKNCTSLETIPTNSIQRWQSLGVSCFEEMFRGCSSLQLLPPILPAITAKDYCYKGMFAYCSNLNVRNTGFSILANNLQNTSGACESMFEGCVSMTSGITADSVKIGPDSYKRMFYGCYNMSYIKQNFSATTSGVFSSINSDNFTKNWVYNVSSTGTFITVNETWFNSYAFYGPNGIPNNTGWRIGV